MESHKSLNSRSFCRRILNYCYLRNDRFFKPDELVTDVAVSLVRDDQPGGVVRHDHVGALSRNS